MDADVATTLITSLAGLGGVTIGAILNGAAQARAGRRRDADDLRGALADTVHVLEGLAFELRLRPRQRPRTRRVSEWLSRVVPELDLPMRELGITLATGPFSIWVVSPQGLTERYDRLTKSLARLGQLGPATVMERVQVAIDLIGEFPATGDVAARSRWDTRWREAMGAIHAEGAAAIEQASKRRPRWRRPSARPDGQRTGRLPTMRGNR